ncbi:MAG: tRNA (guanosine(46)-N7)-methyltransferase TrmB [Spirochaetaceae bacterium]|nr:tRNA (guanosine(46)-N7)-methyltransferase TrmB [Spirochaetaceae bacterium]
MSHAQESSYKNQAKYRLPYSESPVPLQELFQNTGPVICEIGFGMGKVTAAIAGENPDKNYLGIEVFKAGIGRLLWEIEKCSLHNIRVIEHDAVEVLQFMIPDQTIAAFHIFFPDPWPKRRQNKRRLIQRPFTDLLVQKLIPNGYIYMVSDCGDYADWALRELSETKNLYNAYEKFSPPQHWRPETKFEAKARAKNNSVRELFFRKAETSITAP